MMANSDRDEALSALFLTVLITMSVCFVPVGTVSAASGNTSSVTWPTFSADDANTGHVNSTGPTSNINKEWNFTTAGTVSQSATVVDGTVYVGGGDNVYALDADTGNKQWQFSTDGSVGTAPTYKDGTIYVGSNDNNVYALDASTGSEQWKFTTGDFVRSTPVVVNGTVFVGSNDNNLYALDSATGTEEWRFSTGDFVGTSPAVVGETVFFGSDDNNVYALNATNGDKRWNYTTGFVVGSSPAVVDGTVYVGSADGNAYALDANTGAEQWRFGIGWQVDTSPAVEDGTVYIGGGNDLYAIDAASGTENWKLIKNNIVTDPAVVNGTVYFGNGDTNVYAVDADTKEEKWNFSTGKFVSASPAVLNGTVYIGSGDDNVYALTGNTSAGTTDAANFTVTIDSTTSPVNASESLNVTATVENTGGQAGTQTVTLSTDGIQRDATSVTLAGGESQTVTLSWTTDVDDAGSYTATVASANDSADTTVSVGDAVLLDGSTYYIGQALVTDAFDPGRKLDLKTSEGTFLNFVFVSEDGIAVVATDDLSPGNYILTDNSGTELAFRLVRQEFTVSANQSVVQNSGDNTTVDFSVESNRGDYSIVVTSSGLDGATLADAFADGTRFDADDDGTREGLLVDGTVEQSLAADFESVSTGDYTFEFDVPDTTANESVDITVDSPTGTSGGGDATDDDDDPPRFVVSIAIQLPGGQTIPGTNSPIDEGKQLNVTATVTNTGDKRDTQRISLRINTPAGGENPRLVQPDSTNITLNGGESMTITLSWNTSLGDAGQYVATVTSDDEGVSTPVNVTSIPWASGTFNNQSVSSEVDTQGVTVASVEMSDGGFVAIHKGSATGSVIGASSFLSAGTHENVRIALEQNLVDRQTLVAVPHKDTDDDNVYEFEGGDLDEPYTLAGRRIADSALVNVVVDTPVPTGTPSPTPSPTPTPTLTPTPTPTPTLTPMPTLTPTPDPKPDAPSNSTATTPGSDGPGFGAAEILLAIVLITLIAIRRRSLRG